MNSRPTLDKNILIFGATSAIATEVARLYAIHGCRFILVGRQEHKLNKVANDLSIRGASFVECITGDLDVMALHPSLIEEAKERLGRLLAVEAHKVNIDIAFIAHGVLAEQKTLDGDINLALATLHTNGHSAVSLMLHCAAVFEKQGFGALAVIGSVAGDRGRASNYIYGASKALIDRVAQGLSARFAKQPHLAVSVTLIKPGLTRSPMTAHLDSKGLLWANADQIAPRIMYAIEHKIPCVYTPFFWRYIMLVIIHLPRFIFNRLSI